jgi:tetratricopeptide (TPR) repeat protein
LFAKIMPAVDSLPQRLIVHELPSAPKFIGREQELASLKEFWHSDDNVLSLIGLGGAGKTALADQFLKWVEQEETPERLMVWSFYDDPDANAFLETLYRFLTGAEEAEVKGSGWFHLLREQLSSNRKVLLMLDGLERVQRPATDASGIFGELEDPLLRGLLVRLATARGGTKALITSRFPVSTIEQYLNRGYRVLDVEQLPHEAARDLLASRGIQLNPDQLIKFIRRFGSHALSLDLLAGAVAAFFGGDVAKLPDFQADAQPAERLGYVLRLYEEHLPQVERDLLTRLCVFRFGVDAQTMERVFLQNGNTPIAGSLAGMDAKGLEAHISKLVDRHLVYREVNNKFTVHPAVRDHFYRLFRDPKAVHGAIAKHFSTLTDRPGIGLPTDKESLDLLEELVHHAIHSGSYDEAAELYFSRLGGNDHLNGRLGEYARTFRILSAFPECPDPSAMYHCERAFGNFERALDWRPQNRYIDLLAGHLLKLSTDSSEPTRLVAQALMGKPVSIPDRSPDFPVCSAMAHLFRGDPDSAKRVAELEMGVSIYEDDRVRNQIALAEAYRMEGKFGHAKDLIEAASEWVLQSASQEHLSSLHLARANLAIDERQKDVATSAISEGLTISHEAGFRLHEVLFLLALARDLDMRGEASQGRRQVEEALEIARESQFEYAILTAEDLLARM